LRVVDVARLRLDDVELAFLSACSTARPGDRLADEASHLASAFQLAGYRHVLATLWPVPDWPARRAVAAVSDRIASIGEDHADRAPAALHAAPHALRERYPAHPSIWAAFVHAHAGA
jgi:CHAT domain-containing protein